MKSSEPSIYCEKNRPLFSTVRFNNASDYPSAQRGFSQTIFSGDDSKETEYLNIGELPVNPPSSRPVQFCYVIANPENGSYQRLDLGDWITQNTRTGKIKVYSDSKFRKKFRKLDFN